MTMASRYHMTSQRIEKDVSHLTFDVKSLLSSDSGLGGSINSAEGAISQSELPSLTESHSNYWDYVKKMGYSEENFCLAVQKLQEDKQDITNDSLILTLIDIAEPSPMVSDSTQRKTGTVISKRDNSSNLKHVVIDGSNVAMEHGGGRMYSCKGIEIVVQWFLNRGHKGITVFVPEHRFKTNQRQVVDQHILRELRDKGIVIKVPSRRLQNRNVNCHDDRFILKLAAQESAIVVSNDKFRDLKKESDLTEIIEKWILPYTFVNDRFLPAEDPQGRRGLTLDQFLRTDPMRPGNGVCPYGRKCTYGNKCKYQHPERQSKHDSSSLDPTIGIDNHSPLSSTRSFDVTGSNVRMKEKSLRGQRPKSSPVHASQTLVDPKSTKEHYNSTTVYPHYPHNSCNYSQPPYQQTNLILGVSSPAAHQQYAMVSPNNPYGSQITYMCNSVPHHSPRVLASQAYIHTSDQSQSTYYSLPFDNAPSASGNLQPEEGTKLEPLNKSMSEMKLNDNRTSNNKKTGSSRDLLYEKLTKIFQPNLVQQVMETHPDVTDYEKLVNMLVLGAKEHFSV